MVSPAVQRIEMDCGHAQVFRWHPQKLAVPSEVQDTIIERSVNGFLDTHLRWGVKGMSVSYRYDFTEENREIPAPRYYVTLYGTPLAPDEPSFLVGQRGLKIVRCNFDASVDPFNEDRFVEKAIRDQFVYKFDGVAVRELSHQRDIAGILRECLLGIRHLVGVLYEKPVPGAPPFPKGKFYKRHFQPKVVASDQEDLGFSQTLGALQDQHSNEKLEKLAVGYLWIPGGKLRLLSGRFDALTYFVPAQERRFSRYSIDVLNDQRMLASANCGQDVVRYLAPTLMPGDKEDLVACRRLNDWIEKYPDRHIIGITLHYDWGANWGDGINAGRYIFVVNWVDKKLVPEHLWRKDVRAHLFRIVGRPAGEEGWTPQEDDAKFKARIKLEEDRFPKRAFFNVKTKHDFSNFVRDNLLATRHITLALSVPRQESSHSTWDEFGTQVGTDSDVGVPCFDDLSLDDLRSALEIGAPLGEGLLGLHRSARQGVTALRTRYEQLIEPILYGQEKGAIDANMADSLLKRLREIYTHALSEAVQVK